MNRWAAYLAQTPPTLQRLIAASQRISLPRSCTPEVRLARLRAALCRPAAVRAVYFTLEPAERDAVQQLRHTPHGLAEHELAARFGPVRPLAELRADRAPRSISERLLLLGWLLPRPATRNHPIRYLLPPELRTWLPVPIQQAAANAKCATPRAADCPALRAATAILAAAAAAPLAVRGDGRPTAEALRALRPRLAPLPDAEADALVTWLLPLLGDLGLLAPHGAAVVPGPAAARFLAVPPAERLRTLAAAWERCPRPDRWLARLRVNTRGIDWPALRRRLRAWAAALPPETTDPAGAHALLTAALGPLADVTTHGFATPGRRGPWLPRRAAEVWAAACAGPLRWLGELPEGVGAVIPFWLADFGLWIAAHGVPMRSDGNTYAGCSIPIGMSEVGAVGAEELLVFVPRGEGEADLLTIAPFARFVASSAAGDQYALSAASIAAAVSHGHDAARLGPALTRWCAVIPAPIAAALTPADGLELRAGTVLLSDRPEELAAALRRRSARRAVEARLAPGVALVAPGQEAALARALARDGRAVALPPPAATPPPAELSPGEAAALLLAAVFYRAHAPADAPPGPDAALLNRLRAALPPALEASTTAVAAALARQSSGDSNVSPMSATTYGERQASPRGVPEERDPATGDGSRQPGAPERSGADPDQAQPPAGPASRTLPAPPSADDRHTPPLAELLDRLRAVLRRRAAVTLHYQGADEAAPRERVVRPLRIERHGPWWYLHAYCLLAHAERCFRLDRVHGLAPADGKVEAPRVLEVEQPTAGAARRRPAPRRPRSAPRASFFAGPPDTPPGSPFIGVWLDELVSDGHARGAHRRDENGGGGSALALRALPSVAGYYYSCISADDPFPSA